MAQTTGRDNVRGEADKAADMAQEVVAQATDAMTQGIAASTDEVQSGTERMLDAAKDLTEQAPSPMVRLVLDRTAPAMHDMVKAESDLATFWLEMTRDQAQHTIDTMQRLAGVRDWREALDLQSQLSAREHGADVRGHLASAHPDPLAGRQHARCWPRQFEGRRLSYRRRPAQPRRPRPALDRQRSSAISPARAPIRRRSALRRMKPSASR